MLSWLWVGWPWLSFGAGNKLLSFSDRDKADFGRLFYFRLPTLAANKKEKTGLLSQRMTQKPGEFSDSVLLEDYGDRSNFCQYYAVAGNFPGL